MRPNTPHLVITPESSICYGGHFYAVSTLRETCHGLLHTFVASTLITNTDHTTGSRDLLRRLLTYFWIAFRSDYLAAGATGMDEKYRGQVPDIFSVEGLIDLLSLCSITELSNVLHPKSYEKPSLGYSEQAKLREGRTIVRQVFSWLENTISVYSPDDPTTPLALDRDLYFPYIASQARAIRGYKKRAQSQGTHGSTFFTLKDLDRELDLTFRGHEKLAEIYRIQEDRKNFDWPGMNFFIQPKESSDNETEAVPN